MIIGIDIRNIGKKRTGDEVVFFNLVKNLAEIDNSNNYKLFTDIDDTRILMDIKERLGITDRKNFEIISLTFHSSPKGRGGLGGNKFIWNIWTLPRYLRKNPVDVYHTQYITPFFVPRKIKIVTTIHDISFNFFPQFIKLSDLFFLKFLIPVSLKRADKIIAVSNFTRNEIIKFYKINPEKVEVAYNAVNGNFLQSNFSDQQKESVRKKYNLPEKFILYIGTMQPRKNLPFLIEAYACIKDKLPGVKLVIAGKKSRNYDRKIDEVSAEYKVGKYVAFPGYIDEEDKSILFNLSQMFIFPSLYEGFGIPILEAMSQEIPVLAADISSLREVGGDAALYFDPCNLASLEEALYNVFIDEKLRNKITDLGLQRAKFFSWEKTAQKALNVYNSLIS